MVALEFLDHLTKFQITTYAGIEDFTDKFHFQFTVIILMILTLIVTVKQYVLKPISCFMATGVGGVNLLNYLENYCWVQGTIPISFSGTYPESEEEIKLLDNSKLLYYQWVPFALGVQCILFYLPRLMWQLICYSHLGTDIQHLVTSANQAVHSGNIDAQNKMVVYIAKTIAQMCYQHREYRRSRLQSFGKIHTILVKSLCASKRHGTRIIFCYLIHKLLYLLNSILQLYFMHKFLNFPTPHKTDKAGFSLFNFQPFRNIIRGENWHSSLVFPRVGFCFVEIYHLGARNTVAAQCVLPVNMLNERIYFFLWCWITMGFFLTLLSLPIWIWRIYITLFSQTCFVSRYLVLKDIFQSEELSANWTNIKEFEKSFLRMDGVFLLKMISINAGDVIATDIISQLWSLYIDVYTKLIKLPISYDNDSKSNGSPGFQQELINNFSDLHSSFLTKRC